MFEEGIIKCPRGEKEQIVDGVAALARVGDGSQFLHRRFDDLDCGIFQQGRKWDDARLRYTFHLL